MKAIYANVFGGRSGLVSFLILAALILLVLPMSLEIFRLNLVGKYLSFAFVAIGLVMLWGYGGVLSLGQGVFFGLGGYAMAMFLKLEASDPQSTAIQTTPGIPDFMDWNQITELPWFWVPFESLTWSLIAIVLVPGIFAYIIGAAMFKRRVGGVYFAIITQAIALILTILIVGQQGLTGGINGITDLKTLKGWDIRTEEAQYVLYYVCSFLLLGCILLCQFVLQGKLGRLLLAMRDKEDRVRFSGYDVSNFKIFVFCLAAMMSGIGGAMFALQVGFMSPSFVGIIPSIEFVIFAAVGGRFSLIGAVYGALVVSWGKTMFSEAYPEMWLFLMGALFISVVMFFPKGLAGLWESHGYRMISLFSKARGGKPTPDGGGSGAAPPDPIPDPTPVRPRVETVRGTQPAPRPDIKPALAQSAAAAERSK